MFTTAAAFFISLKEGSKLSISNETSYIYKSLKSFSKWGLPSDFEALNSFKFSFFHVDTGKIRKM